MKICLVEVLLVYAHKKRYEINVKLSHLLLSQLTRLAGLEILDTMVCDRENVTCQLIPKQKIPRKRKPESQNCAIHQI